VDAGQHGWRMLFADQYPYAGGTGHYAAYLENADGFEAELVAPSEALLEPPAVGAAPGQAAQAAQSAQAVQVGQAPGGGATQSHGAPPAGSAGHHGA
jgi:hypothetical protein